jgi:TPR repeat protein
MYEEGNGVPQDNGMAEFWYRKAAKQGHAEAQWQLGQMYEYDGY